MYIIPIGTFADPGSAVLVLIHGTKKRNAMKRKFIEMHSVTAQNQDHLIEGCRRGEPAAQLMVYKLYYRSVYNICLHIVNDPSRAEDIMQE